MKFNEGASTPHAKKHEIQGQRLARPHAVELEIRQRSEGLLITRLEFTQGLIHVCLRDEHASRSYQVYLQSENFLKVSEWFHKGFLLC